MDIVTETGVTIRLEEIYGKRTYSGAMAGSQSAATRFILEDLTRVGLPSEWSRFPTVGIDVERYMNDPTSTLPHFVFAALFVSMRQDDADSVLVIVWFQDSYFQPLDAKVMNEIRLLDWRHLSVADYYYG